jgi:predicted DNA-binding protein
MANVAAHKMRTTVVLPRVLKAEVEAIAEREGVPMGHIVREALEALAAGRKEKELEAA